MEIALLIIAIIVAVVLLARSPLARSHGEATEAETRGAARHHEGMPRFRAEVVLYFEAQDLRAVPRRLRELAAAAEAVGFDFHTAKAEEGSEPDTDGEGWTGYAPLPEPPG